jgi:tryptophan 2,3-dioxygenase
MAGTDYSTYLKINDLLTLQVPLTEGAPDELLFIVVHQSYELWFKVIIDEIERATAALLDGAPWRARPHLTRMVSVERLLSEHLAVLETMSPEGFLAFRDPLDPASGFQSFQFRAIEFLSGGGKESMLSFPLFSDETRAWLRAMAERRSLADGLREAVAHLVPGEESYLEKLVVLYRSHDTPERSALHEVAELLLDHDEHLMKWRHQHMLMAGRQIGRRQGTGGSDGMAYLETTLGVRLYPELWEVRSVL